MNTLNDEDIRILVEALDAWINRNASGEIMGDLLEAVLSEKGDRTDAKAKQAERREKARQEKLLDQETATLLKAKLIGIRRNRMLGVSA